MEALQGWGNFFFMLGGAAATLTGLMFVAVSMGANLNVEQRTITGVQIYVTPTLVNFVLVFVTACVMLVPVQTLLSLTLLLGLVGCIGLYNIFGVLRRMKKTSFAGEELDKIHILWHVWLPLLSYATMILVGIGYGAGAFSPIALVGIAAAAVLVLVSCIRNTWVLTLWIISRKQ